MEGQPIETDLPPDSASPCRRRGSCRWTVYLLRCRDGSLYTGITNDLPKRLKAHAAGKASRYTRSRLPVDLAYEEHQPTKSRALKREAAIKRLPRRAKLDLIPPPKPDKRGRPSHRS
jgi:putative endonuclease